MTKINSLLLLINSLTKSEKRNLKLISSLQHGEKDYLILLGIMEHNPDIGEIKNQFDVLKPNASFEATVKYLYKVIMDSLLNLRSSKDFVAQMTTDLLKANILFEKALYDDGIKQLRKIIKTASGYEQYNIQIRAAQLELYYLCSLNFQNLSEKELLQKQMAINNLMNLAKNNHQHLSAYELLHHRLLHKGSVRTPKQKDDLQDLLLNELNLMANPLAVTYESKKAHLLFQANYFIMVNEYRQALETFYELIILMEDKLYLKINSPIDYLLIIEGILDSLRTIRHYDEMGFFLEKLEKMEKNTVYFEIMVQKVIYIFKSAAAMDNGRYEEALKIKYDFEATLFQKLHLLDIHKKAEIYLHCALLYFGMNDIDNANKSLSNILMDGKLYYHLPVYRTCRILNLLIHYEMKDFEYITYEIRSIKRHFSNTDGSYLLEKILFRFFRQPLDQLNNKQKQKFGEEINIAIKSIEFKKDELRVLKIFDFRLWLKAKIEKISFAQLLTENDRRNKAMP